MKITLLQQAEESDNHSEPIMVKFYAALLESRIATSIVHSKEEDTTT